jgi:hypothetical protein
MRVVGETRGARCGILLLAVAASVPMMPASGAEAVPSGTAQCNEDGATGETPTISSRFDLAAASEGGASFVDARARASRYCAGLACTIEGRSVARVASIYAVGVLHRRYIAGFRCVPPNNASLAQQSAPAAVSYTLGEPGEIDAALAKANAHCAAVHAKAELSDLRKKDGALVAVFACAS